MSNCVSLTITDEILAVYSLENRKNYCHKMSDFKAKVQQKRFDRGSAPDPAYSAPQTVRPLAGIKGIYF